MNECGARNSVTFVIAIISNNEPPDDKIKHVACMPAKTQISLRIHQKVSEYDQEIPQSHTADHPMAP